MAGAVFAAFALSRQRASAARQAFPSFLAALLIGIGTTAHHRRSWTSLNRVPASEADLLGQAVFALLYGVLRGGGGGFSRCSRFTRLSVSKRWSGEWFALAFGNLCLGSVGDLAFAYGSHFQRIGICSGDPICDHCSHFIRSASLLLLASQRYVSLTCSGTCSG